MAQATNLTIKKADGTTDVTYTVQIASGGDKAPAVWQDLQASSTPNARPSFSFESTANGAKTARRSTTRYEYPYYVTNTDGTVTLKNRVLVTSTTVVPLDVPSDVAAEAVAQEANLRATALIKGSAASGYAPT